MTDAPDQNPWEPAYWNGPAGERWVRHQEQLDRAFAAFTRAMMDAAALRPGEQVMDVGCGCGDTTIAAAALVAPSGAVLGVDVSAPMLARAEERARGLSNVRFLRADAGTHDLAGAFDAIVSRFGVMFFAEPVAAFANLRRSLRTGGRAALVCWRSFEENRWAAEPAAAAARALGRAPAPSKPGHAGPFAFADAGHVRRVLADARFDRVSLRAVDGDVLLSTSGPEDAAHLAAHSGPAGRMLAEASPDERMTAVRAIATALTPHVREGRVALRGAAWLIEAGVTRD